jgi:Flp pilus assembly protein TadG
MRVTNGSRSHGQALVEFSLALLVFLVLVMGVVDFGVAIYQFNGVSQAAREIARVTSVHPGADFNTWSLETNAVIATQKGLIPNLGNPTQTCVNSAGTPVSTLGRPCNYAKDSVRVNVTAPYKAVTPLLGLLGTWTMQGTSSAQLQIAP